MANSSWMANSTDDIDGLNERVKFVTIEQSVSICVWFIFFKECYV